MRWYLPNIARFPSVDPLEKSYPWNSVYAFAEGNPIEFIDLDGGERKHYKIEFDQKTHKPNLTFVKQEDIVTLHPISVAEPLSGQLEYEARTNEYEEYVLHKPITAYLWREGVDPKRMDGEVTFTTRDWNKVQNAQETDFPSSTRRWVLAQHAQNMHDAGTGGSGVSMRRNVSKSTTKNLGKIVLNESECLSKAQIAIVKGKGYEYYRGGSSFKIRYSDIKVDKKTGLGQPSHGLSLNTDPTKVEKFGGAYKIDYLPDELDIIQRGTKDINHFEVVPKVEMTKEKFQSLLDQIKTSKVND